VAKILQKGKKDGANSRTVPLRQIEKKGKKIARRYVHTTKTDLMSGKRYDIRGQGKTRKRKKGKKSYAATMKEKRANDVE